jgi:putative flavoprotein involved in K+ transport
VTGKRAHSRQLAGTNDVVVIGAGHAGLAMSSLLGWQGVDHVVLERGKIANSWRQERWDSLRLLTPNWQTRLPGKAYSGSEPDGFMTVAELVRFLDGYAAGMQAPVRTGTEVESLSYRGGRYHVGTSRGRYSCRAVVIASGACNIASVPELGSEIPATVTQLTPLEYRSPDDLEPGGVLVVGASATGLQLARELRRAGHEVTLAVGEHVRMPRSYRGRDIFHWLHRSGIHDERYDEIDDLDRGRRLPSPQLIGSSSLPILDLNALSGQGVTLAGRLVGVRDGVAQFSGSLRNVCALADLKMQRLLKRLDSFADAEGAPAAEQFEPTGLPARPLLGLDLAAQVRTVIWATGFRPDYRWLQVPVCDKRGRLVHDGGVVASPGLYVLGLPLMRRRKSSFIFGIEDDARDIAAHLLGFLDSTSKDIDHGIHQYDSPGRGLRLSA